MNDDSNERIEKLEFSLVHLQRTVEQLNDVVTEEAMRADRLQRKIGELERQLKQSKNKDAEDSSTLEDERPPHY